MSTPASVINSPSAVPYFGRAWQISLDTQGSNGQDGQHYVLRSLVGPGEEPLRVQFAVDTAMMLSLWTGDVTIYNLRQAPHTGASLGEALTSDMLILAGDTVTISAGYKGPSGFSADSNMIFSGRVFQPVLTRVGVVDWVMKLRCACGLLENTMNFVNMPLTGAATYYDTLKAISETTQDAGGAGFGPIDLDDASATILKAQSLSRGQVFFSRPYDIFRELMQQTTLFGWLEPAPPPTNQTEQIPYKPSLPGETPSTVQPKPTLHVRSFRTLTDPEISYGPPNLDPNVTRRFLNFKPTLIDVPEATDKGIIFRVLMDSSLRIGQVVQVVQGTVISPFQFLPFQNSPPVPSRNGIYVVFGLRHVGDTRGQGDDWYSEVTGVNYSWFTGFVNSMTGGRPYTGTGPEGLEG
jgi:hypothetical protein